MLKNSIKVMFGNLGLVWKSLLYKLVSLIVSIGLVSPLIVPVVTNLARGGFFQRLNQVFGDLVFNINLTSLVENVKNLSTDFSQIITSNNQVALVIISIILGVVIYYFFNSLLKNAVLGSVMSFMSSYAKTTFFGNYLTDFKKSVTLAGIKLLIELPFLVIIIVLSVLTFIGLSTLPVLAMFMTIACFTVLISLKTTIFAGFETSVYIHNYSVMECFKCSLKILKNKGLKIFSDNIFITIFELFTNLLMIMLTACVGLIITIPLFMLANVCYNAVVYYDYNGMRYYLDSNNIFTPKKLEEKDSFNKIKNII